MDLIEKKIKADITENTQIDLIKDDLMLLVKQLEQFDLNKQQCKYQDLEDIDQGVQNMKNQIEKLKKNYKYLEVKQIIQDKEINCQQYMNLFKQNLKENIIKDKTSSNGYEKEDWHYKKVEFTSPIFADNLKLNLNSSVGQLYKGECCMEYSLGGTYISVVNISENNNKKQDSYKIFNFKIDWDLEDNENEEDYYNDDEKPIKLVKDICKPDYNEYFIHVGNLKKFISECLDPENNLAKNQNFNMEVLVDEMSQLLFNIAKKHCGSHYDCGYGFDYIDINDDNDEQQSSSSE